ncbi:MAG: NAD-dependent epimerase/dehydratase family protein [Cytophagaceae bacterium]
MKILVTGASGLLGGHVTRQLYEEGHTIRLFLRKTSGLKGLEGYYHEVVYGCLEDCEDVFKAVEGCDAVIHSASVTGTANTSLSYYEPANVHGTKHIVDAVLAYNVEKLVYVSTANCLGPGCKDNPGTERSLPCHFDLKSGYIDSKYIAQQYVMKQVADKNLQAVVVNPTFIIGTHDYKPSSGQMILHGLKKIQLFPSGGKNFVPAIDAARGVILALYKGKVGECYLLAGENFTYKEFFDMLNNISGNKPLQIRLPKPLFNFMGLLGTMAGKLLGKHFSLNYCNTRVLSLENYYSGSKAREQLGLKCTSVENAIKETVEWFAAQNSPEPEVINTTK